jgi:hypothetical protein
MDQESTMLKTGFQRDDLNEAALRHFHLIYEVFRARPDQIASWPGLKGANISRQTLIMHYLREAEKEIEGLVYPEGLDQDD